MKIGTIMMSGITMIIGTRMKHLLKIVALSIGLMLLIGFSFFASLACEPTLPLEIENQTDTALTIYVQGNEKLSVEPKKSVEVEGIPGTLTHYLIEAKNSEGKVIYSRRFSTSELHDADWKVVIPPLQNK